MPIRSAQHFIELFGTAVITSTEPFYEKFIKKIGQILTHFRPIITFDNLTGQPSLEMKMINSTEIKYSLEDIFRYIKKLDKVIVIALDEFQQAEFFSGESILAYLRTYIQSTPNARFIFSGSKKQMLSNMFSHPAGLFFRSTDILYLEPINTDDYKIFLIKKFEEGKKKLTADALNLIFSITRGHTFYVQYLCNRLFEITEKRIDERLVASIFNYILDENEHLFYGFKNLLTEHQWQLMLAIAKEGRIDMPTSKEFIAKYQLSAASTVSTALASLINKEMLYEYNGYYFVYDVFLSEWLKRII
jgi:hypothetical protein